MKRARRPTIRRSCARYGVIDLPTMQRYLNFHYSVTIDLFGADQSSNAAIVLRRRASRAASRRRSATTTTLLKGASYPILEVAGRHARRARSVPMLNALNEVLRDDFIRDSMAGVGRWNKVIEKHGLAVPAAACRTRRSTGSIGTLARLARRRPDGRVLSRGRVGTRRSREWLPTD